MKTKKKKGFTLTELIVVIVIIGVLAAVMIPTLSGYITKAKNSKDETLVASLNKSYQNAKIMDDLEFYTAYDVDAFLKEVEMDNIEVANKNSLILFDADDEKFVLVKDIEKETKVNEFVYHISEYYSYKALKAEPISNKNSNAVLKPLASKKLGDEEESSTYEFHRAFIISINGNEISEAVATFMKINGDTTQDELNEMKSVFTKTYSDSKFKENLSNAISKTLFIGKTKSFYIDSNYEIKVFTGTNPSGQSLKRVAILGDVEELDLSKISNLNNSTIIIPNTVSNVIIPDTLESSIQLSGNVDKDNEHYIDLNSALILPLAKELLDVNPNVKNENELNDVLKCYDSESIIKTIVKKTGLSESNSMIINLKTELDKIDKTIIVVSDFEITKESITIPYDVTLLIPYDGKNGVYKTDAPGATPIAKIYIDENTEDINGRKVNLIISENTVLDVYGTIQVGGILNSYQPIVCNTFGSYGQITNNGTINLYSSSKNSNDYNGKLDVYGYVIGNGKICSYGGIITQPITIGDFGGGSNASALYAFGFLSSSPFTQYCLANIWCETIIDSESKYNCRGCVYANQINEIPEFSIIEKGGSSALIRMNENTEIQIKYNANEKIDDNRNKLTCLGKVHIIIKGGAETGALKMDLGETSIDSSKFTLPIPYSFCYEFKNSSETEIDEYKILSEIALLPGSKLLVDNGTKLIISSDGALSVFDDLENYQLTLNSASHAYPQDLEGAKLIVNGTLEVVGGLGGKVLSETSGAKLIIGSSAKGAYTGEHNCSDKSSHCTRKKCMHSGKNCNLKCKDNSDAYPECYSTAVKSQFGRSLVYGNEVTYKKYIWIINDENSNETIANIGKTYTYNSSGYWESK